MLADIVQTIGVVLVVVAATGYLMVLLRRSWRGGGGCGCCGAKTPPVSAGACRPEVPGDTAKLDRVPTRQIISVDQLAGSARDCASESKERRVDPPSQVS
jgi:hypothetical protein